MRLGSREFRITTGHYWHALQESRSRPAQIKPPVNVILQALNHTLNTLAFKFGPPTVTTREKVVGQRLEFKQLVKIFLSFFETQAMYAGVREVSLWRARLVEFPSAKLFF